MSKKRIYSFSIRDKIDAQLPETVKTAMGMSGWNALGIYELVAKELRKEAKCAAIANGAPK